jgi:hypothetical protein
MLEAFEKIIIVIISMRVFYYLFYLHDYINCRHIINLFSSLTY